MCPKARPEFADCADNVIQAGRRCGFDDKLAVGGEIFVPLAWKRCVEIPPQALDGLAQPRFVSLVTVDEVSTDPLGLRPKPRDRVGNTSILFNAIAATRRFRSRPLASANAISLGTSDGRSRPVSLDQRSSRNAHS